MTDPTYREQDLVMLLRRRDRQAYAQLYDRYSGALYNIICQIMPDRELGNDVLQDVFVSIWRKIESYDESKGRLFTWMLNIARNAAIDTLRSKGYRNNKMNREMPEDDAPGIGQTEQPNVDNIGLRKMVNGLKEEHRILVDLAYFKGYTHDEIAKETGIPLGTVKTRIRSALIQLRQMMK